MITKPIKTNIITGFLGVGKTTLIKQLLAHKPPDEVWAVLVNEFGEIGIDGSLLNTVTATSDNNQADQQQNQAALPSVVIKEVPGGCLCCAAGVMTQVAINQLIQQAKPDRLLIEPTGLGHPAEIITLLQAPHFQQVIKLQTSLCLVDARKISDDRYYNHDTFIQQLQIADTVIANKAQYYTEQDKQQLTEFMAQLQRAETPVLYCDDHFTQTALLQQIIDLLDQPTAKLNRKESLASTKPTRLLTGGAKQWLLPMASSTSPVNDDDQQFDQQQLAEQGFIYKTNQGEGCYSSGWIIDSQRSFNFELFMRWVELVKALNVLRLKAIVITDDGILSVNMVDDTLSLDELDDALDSRIEIISETPLDGDTLQQQLFACAI
ncbi:GTP-binding protein [Shewanella sp. MEBiC00475]|uniref:CobW family GTP-binding protein n=1 Tax=Shewanella sp. MEBiC00475 TaxID=2575361 RepID=UPI0010C0D9BB|nr:GTP-binding protein [Shewanella sp. MEBiC00475]